MTSDGKVEITGVADPNRGQWGSQIEFMLACIGYAVGLGNVWRFPYLCYENGGGAFLVPYALSLLLVGLPIFYMELAIGQFSSLGPNMIFKHLSPLFTGSNSDPVFQGVGWAMATVSFTTAVYYHIIIAWVMLYFVLSFRGTMMWDTCTGPWNTYRCFSNRADDVCKEADPLKPLFFNLTCWENTPLVQELRHNLTTVDKLAKSPAEEFFNNFVYNLRELEGDGPGVADFAKLGGLEWYLVLSLFACWVVVFLCLIKGVQSTGKVVYFTATFPYVVLVVLFFRGVTLVGAGEGVKFYITPDLAKLADVKVWRAAATQIFYSLGPTFGSLLTMASYNKFNNNCYRDALIVGFTNCGTSVFAGFAIFSTLGFMAQALGKEVSEVVQSGPSLAFIVYPEAIVRMPFPPIWALLFFFMLFTLGLDTQFAFVECVTTVFLDRFVALRKRKWAVVGIACLVMFLLGLPMCLGGGIYLFTVFDTFAASYSLLLIAMFEIVVVIHLYGLGRFCRDVEMMLGRSSSIFGKILGPTGWYWKIMWVAVSPLLMLFIFAASFVYISPMTYNEKQFPPIATVIGWCLAVLPAIVIFVFMIIVFVENQRKGGRPGDLIKATPQWCPEHMREEAELENMEMNKVYPAQNRNQANPGFQNR